MAILEQVPEEHHALDVTADGEIVMRDPNIDLSSIQSRRRSTAASSSHTRRLPMQGVASEGLGDPSHASRGSPGHLSRRSSSNQSPAPAPPRVRTSSDPAWLMSPPRVRKLSLALPTDSDRDDVGGYGDADGSSSKGGSRGGGQGGLAVPPLRERSYSDQPVSGGVGGMARAAAPPPAHRRFDGAGAAQREGRRHRQRRGTGKGAAGNDGRRRGGGDNDIGGGAASTALLYLPLTNFTPFTHVLHAAEEAVGAGHVTTHHHYLAGPSVAAGHRVRRSVPRGGATSGVPVPARTNLRDGDPLVVPPGATVYVPVWFTPRRVGTPERAVISMRGEVLPMLVASAAKDSSAHAATAAAAAAAAAKGRHQSHHSRNSSGSLSGGGDARHATVATTTTAGYNHGYGQVNPVAAAVAAAAATGGTAAFSSAIALHTYDVTVMGHAGAAHLVARTVMSRKGSGSGAGSAANSRGGSQHSSHGSPHGKADPLPMGSPGSRSGRGGRTQQIVRIDFGAVSERMWARVAVHITNDGGVACSWRARVVAGANRRLGAGSGSVRGGSVHSDDGGGGGTDYGGNQGEDGDSRLDVDDAASVGSHAASNFLSVGRGMMAGAAPHDPCTVAPAWLDGMIPSSDVEVFMAGSAEDKERRDDPYVNGSVFDGGETGAFGGQTMGWSLAVPQQQNPQQRQSLGVGGIANARTPSPSNFLGIGGGGMTQLRVGHLGLFFFFPPLIFTSCLLTSFQICNKKIESVGDRPDPDRPSSCLVPDRRRGWASAGARLRAWP
jgi:hypothetical protein